MFKIITVGRECGSGGHTIARKTAEKLGIPCYDKELISLVAEKSGVSEEFVENACEQLQGGIGANFFTFSDHIFPYSTPSLQDQINSIQVEIIETLAEKGPCVIVGRGADYILRNRDDVLNVFIKADMDYKIKISKEKHDLDEKEAKSILKKRDKERSKHYYFYTGQVWGEAKNYAMVLDAGILGEDKCVDILVETYKK